MNTSLLIAVDIGNSFVKFGVFQSPDIQAAPSVWPEPSSVISRPTAAIISGDDDALREWLPGAPVHWRIVSVHRRAGEQLTAWIDNTRPSDTRRQLAACDIPMPLEVEYPERVGVDRLVAAFGACLLRKPNEPMVVVDCGTAVTVDLVSQFGAFLGGAILPGMAISSKALAGFTDALPLVQDVLTNGPPPPIGKSTQAAIRSGLFYSAVGGIRELAHRFSENLGRETIEIIIAGGSAPALAAALGASARFVPHLVLSSIASLPHPRTPAP